MLVDQPKKQTKVATKVGTKSAGMRDAYRKMLRTPELTDQEIDKMRNHVIQFAQTLCEHAWRVRFY